MKEELLRLAERCEKATAPDRKLDGAIHGAIGDAFRQHQIERMGAFGPSYTASLDAAMTLVPDGRCWRVIAWPKNTAGPKGGALVEGSPDATGATPALALCAAALRASVKEQNNGK